MDQYVMLRFGDRVRYECRRCGQCCDNGPNVGLTAFDILRISDFLGVDWKELRGRYIVAVIADMVAIPTLRGKAGGKCVFLKLEEGPSCSIYPARPMRCQLYPFMPYSPSNNEKMYLSSRCSGLNVKVEIEPPWEILKKYYVEIQQHYLRLYRLTFYEGYTPLEALERTIEEIANMNPAH